MKHLASFCTGALIASVGVLTALALSEPITLCTVRVTATVWEVVPTSEPRKSRQFGWSTKTRTLVGNWATENGVSVCEVDLRHLANKEKQ